MNASNQWNQQKKKAQCKGLGPVYLSIRLTNFSLSVCACAHVGGSLCTWLCVRHKWPPYRADNALYGKKCFFSSYKTVIDFLCLRRYLGVHQLQTIRTYNRDSLNLIILARIVFPSIETSFKNESSYRMIHLFEEESQGQSRSFLFDSRREFTEYLLEDLLFKKMINLR